MAQRGGDGRGHGGRFDPTEMAQREKENVIKKVENLTTIQSELLNGIYDEFSEALKETIDYDNRLAILMA